MTKVKVPSLPSNSKSPIEVHIEPFQVEISVPFSSCRLDVNNGLLPISSITSTLFQSASVNWYASEASCSLKQPSPSNCGLAPNGIGVVRPSPASVPVPPSENPTHENGAMYSVGLPTISLYVPAPPSSSHEVDRLTIIVYVPATPSMSVPAVDASESETHPLSESTWTPFESRIARLTAPDGGSTNVTLRFCPDPIEIM